LDITEFILQMHESWISFNRCMKVRSVVYLVSKHTDNKYYYSLVIKVHDEDKLGNERD